MQETQQANTNIHKNQTSLCRGRPWPLKHGPNYLLICFIYETKLK